MNQKSGTPRRAFLQNAAFAASAAAQTPGAKAPARMAAAPAAPAAPASVAAWPRVFEGRHLAMIAFPLGGVAAGSVSLGGRGQLRDWEIFNRPNKGYRPTYGFPSIWVRAGKAKPVARVLEARILPPYEGSSGLGSENAPGLSRLESAKFTGGYPFAHIDFHDRTLPVQVTLDAFSPVIPHDPEDSGLPVAVLRYSVKNPGRESAAVSIAFSLQNMIVASERPRGAADAAPVDSRSNEVKSSAGLDGLLLSNPGLPAEDPMRGSIAFAFAGSEGGEVTHWRGWPRSRWWNPPMLFWDDFSDDGKLGSEPDPRNEVGSLCLQRTIAPGAAAAYTLLLAWHFPNRTPEWCGWSAPKGDEHTVIGNHYATRFAGAWEAAEYAARNLDKLESRSRQFAAAIRESTLPPAVKDGATANLSTLATTTAFRTADGEFHGFEGVNDKRGCCFGNCTHVWNYETTTPFLFPSFARSLRKAAYGYSMDDAGAIHFRQLLPEGKARSGFAAADGQMGQIVHAYIDWIQSGDDTWMRDLWPRVKKSLEFAWVSGGWDADRDGVLEGVQHNTYDVEFFGPNPQCGVYYLAGLRACEEMAKAMGDQSSAAEYRRLFESGSKWIDANLFNGEFYIQKVRGLAKEKIAPALRSQMGSDDTENPEYQVGEGCLADQLIGQYLADVAGLGPLLDPKNIRKTLESIYKYNFKRSLANHDSVQRTYALNDEAGIVVCDYGKAERPRIPFPYYAEVWTGLEYLAASQMIYAGMVREGIECVTQARARYDGERRNPWNEPECGHHYARAMSAWSTVLALSGFRYNGRSAAVAMLPRVNSAQFRCFWSTATGWGTFTLARNGGVAGASLKVLSGSLPCASCEIGAAPGKSVAVLNGKALDHRVEREGSRAVFRFERLTLAEGNELRLEVRA
jgi:non-lysosomal glucosylceramidase